MIRIVRTGIIIVSAIIIGGAFYIANYRVLWSRENLVALFLVLVSIFNILPQYLYFRNEARRRKQ